MNDPVEIVDFEDYEKNNAKKKPVKKTTKVATKKEG